MFGTLALGTKATHGALVAGHVFAMVLAHEVLNADIHDTIVSFPAPKVNVSVGGSHLEDIILAREQHNVGRVTFRIIDKHIAISASLLFC